MAGDTQITVVGNLVDDPELRFTPSGASSGWTRPVRRRRPVEDDFRGPRVRW